MAVLFPRKKESVRGDKAAVTSFRARGNVIAVADVGFGV
jgi:hypothetical protein